MIVTEVSESNRDESATVTALRAGDAEAFEQLVRELTPGLTRLAQGYVTLAVADEVVQETWAAVLRSIDNFEQRSSLKTWIYRILLNKVRTLGKRESRIVPFAAMGNSGGDNPAAIDPELLTDPVRGPGFWARPPRQWDIQPDEQLTNAETLTKVRTAIDALPPAQREVMDLRDVQGWASDEVCDALGISGANQRVLLHRGRVAVRRALEEYLADE